MLARTQHARTPSTARRGVSNEAVAVAEPCRGVSSLLRGTSGHLPAFSQALITAL